MRVCYNLHILLGSLLRLRCKYSVANYALTVLSVVVITCPAFLIICNAVFCIYGFCMLLTVNSDYFLETY
jgi:hypothetical protein